MKIQQAKEIHKLLVEERWVDAGNRIRVLIGKSADIKNKAQAVKVCQGLFQFLLDQELYLEAASLQWGGEIFQCEPESVTREFIAIHKTAQLLAMGASSMGKTYGLGAWFLLDYLRDPLYTSVKLAAINEDHLRKNLFAHVVRLFRACAIPSVHEIIVRDTDLWMGVKGAGQEFGISGIAFKQSQETSGQFKGYKAMPVRKIPHPKFGYMSRFRVLGDEGQNWPGGPFKDFNSLTASKTGAEMIKIAIAFNPESTSQLVVQMAEPEQGWNIEEADTLYDYESKAGWTVCRLDAAKCENVIQKKIVFPGLQTYDGYLAYLKAGGDNSPNYWCFGRGFPPVKGSVYNVISPSWPTEQRGEAIFINNPVTIAAVDIAFEGGDSAQMSVGRWGLASGWRNHMGQATIFKDRLDIAKSKPRHVLEIQQLLPMSRHDDTVKMAEEIIGRCRMLQITPDHLALDKTGVGFGVHSHLTKVWGPVYGISWNEGATEAKMLAEDTEGADKQVDGIMSEMWWCFRRWIDPRVCAIVINPIVPTQPLHTQLTSRRYTPGKAGRIKVESKDQYKSRNAGKSPDEADSVIMLPMLVRQFADVIPGTVEQESRSKSPDDSPIKFESADRMISIEKDDSISESPKSDDFDEIQL